MLRREMARLKRNCHRLIWLNPQLGAPDYEPLTRGIQAAHPTIDNFLRVHKLASLEDLAKRLADLNRSRYLGREKSLNTKATRDIGVENRLRVKVLILCGLVSIVVRINGGTHARYSV